MSSSSKKISAAVTKPVDVSDPVWLSFLLVRKSKKAAVTELAILGIRREAVKAGIELEQALTTCCERGWASFKAEWVQSQQGRAQPKAESFYERDKRAKREEMAKWAPGIAARDPDELKTLDVEVSDVIAIEGR